MIDIVNRVLPILLLIVIGVWMRRSSLVDVHVVDGLRVIVVNVALPAVLFTAFLSTDYAVEDLAIVLFVFSLCVALYGAGLALRPRFGREHDYFPFLMTGFESGMLGISLFVSAYGLANLGSFAVIDLGHELFIWFVFLTLLLARRDGTRSVTSLARAFFASPVIIAILAGLAAGLLGVEEELRDGLITGGVLNTLDFLAALTVPLILLIVGYGIHLDRGGLRSALAPVGVRVALTLPLALLLPAMLIGSLLGGDEIDQAALFTLLILPPPFIIPLYMRTDVEDERRYVNNVLSVYTLVSITLFIVYVSLNPL